MKSIDEEIKDVLSEVCEKYGITNASFTGKMEYDGETKYLGLLHVDRTIEYETDMVEVIESVFNVGRLWQHARGATRTMLNVYEKHV